MVPAIVVFATPPVEDEDAPAVAKPVAIAATVTANAMDVARLMTPV